MSAWRLVLCIFCFMALPALGWPQRTTTLAGTVVGTVICDDGGYPARLAVVRLLEIDMTSRSVRDGVVQSTTDLQGRFVLSSVPVGDYMLDVVFPGYISYSDHATLSSGNGSSKPEPTIVHVGKDNVTNVTFVLVRGSTLSGTVVYEDGVAAAGVMVTAVLLENGNTRKPSADCDSKTDDQGTFRIPGLDDGSYTLSVSIPSPGGVFYKPTYLGDTTDLMQAKKISLTLPEDVKGLEIKLPPPTKLLDLSLSAPSSVNNQQ